MSDFTNRCTSTLEANGDEASKVEKYDEAFAAYSTAVSLSPSTPRTLLSKWARLILVRGSVNEALDAATKVRVARCILELDVDSFSLQFQLPKLVIYRAICEVLEQDGRLTEAVRFQNIQNDSTEDTSTYTAWEVGEWVQDSVSRGVPNILNRLSTSLYGEAGRFSDGRSEIRRGRQTLFRVIDARSLECQRCPLQAKQGTSTQKVVESGINRCRKGMIHIIL